MLSGRREAPARRSRALEAGVALLVLAAYLFFAWSDELADFGGDNAVYWLTANHYSPFGAEHPLAARYAAGSKYPPLYAWILAVTGGGTNLLIAHLVSAVLLWSGCLAACAFYREIGVSRGASLALALVVALLPSVRYGAIELQSEDLFLPVTLATLALTARLARRQDERLLLPLALLLPAAVLTRTAGIALIAAYGLWALSSRRPLRLLPLAVAGLAWYANSRLQDSTGQYTGELVAGYVHDGVLARFLSQWSYLPAEWSRALGGPITTWGPVIVLSLLGLLLVAAAVRRAWQRTADGYYAVLYLLILVLWPFPAEMQRLASMIVPVLLGQGCLLVTRGRPTPRRVSLGFAVVSLPILAFALPDAAKFVGRLLVPVPEDVRPYVRTGAWQHSDPADALSAVGLRLAAARAFADVERLVPAEDCVYAIKPSVISLYSRRRSEVPPRAADAAAFDAAARASGCRYFLMMDLSSPSYPEPLFPLRLMQDRLAVLALEPHPYRTDQRPIFVLATWKDGAAGP